MDLKLEINEAFARANDAFIVKGEGNDAKIGVVALMITPPLDEDYWLFRVKLHEDQAIVGFPKFSTIGVGFAQEEDWNTNLPYSCDVEQIFDHIKHNKKYDEIADDQCIAAIKLVQEAAKKLQEQKGVAQA